MEKKPKKPKKKYDLREFYFNPITDNEAPKQSKEFRDKKKK